VEASVLNVAVDLVNTFGITYLDHGSLLSLEQGEIYSLFKVYTSRKGAEYGCDALKYQGVTLCNLRMNVFLAPINAD
jgi:hypothetical protein